MFRSCSDPESVSDSEVAFCCRWIGRWNLRRTKLGTGAFFLFLFLSTTRVKLACFLRCTLTVRRTLHVHRLRVSSCSVPEERRKDAVYCDWDTVVLPKPNLNLGIFFFFFPNSKRYKDISISCPGLQCLLH